MALQKLYYIFGLDTGSFFTDEEHILECRLMKARRIRTRFKQKYASVPECKELTHKMLNAVISKTKAQLKQMLADNANIVRSVRRDCAYDKNGEPLLTKRIATFDSALTRCCGMKEREFNDEIVVVKVYFFEIAKSIIQHGFYLNGQKYSFFSASAGQIRTKKLVAVRDDVLKKHWNTLTAGLTIDEINRQGGMNVNKAIAYTALANSATDLWNDFCIDRCIVVDDFENTIRGDVDFIDEKTYDIQRRNMELEFTQTDGVGMMLPSVSEKNFMVRLPWFKGLLSPFDFVRFIKKYGYSPVVNDIWGTPHDVIAEDIRIIFTKSQFKMYKFYSDWETYKKNFKLYNCTAGKCNEEEDFSDAVINYQMIQTLHDLSDSEIKRLAKLNDTELNDLATDMKTMLKVFGAVPWNTNKTGFQKCLEKYPELLSDSYTRKTLREIKVKLEKDLWSARFQIKGKYTFVVPDLYAFCEYLFKHEAQPKGLLENGEVCCNLFPVGAKLDCLRSPHLYIEHPIRINTDQSEWFKTDAIYISCHDFISRIVMCDYDGDKLLVTDNETLVAAAERNMKDVVPLFYNMSKAGAEMITPDNLYKGITLAYNGGNIGMPSNNITKVWNSANISEEQMKVVKWLVMEVNFTID